MGGIGLGVFQVLVEKHIIKYESSCTTTIGDISSAEELFSSIQSKDLVACDVPQIEIFSLSLAGWNVLYMLFTLCLSLVIMYKKRKSLLNDRN
jgi:disulfide bond formation protein DsbB